MKKVPTTFRFMKDGYLFFFCPEDPFSNWHPTQFIHRGLQFDCSEQYMMWAKADFFEDFDIASQIMKTHDPQKQKWLGRQVKNFDAQRWDEVSYQIVLDGCLSKFEQNPRLLRNLLDTEDLILVEASPWNAICDDVGVVHLHSQNRLGLVLMAVRDKLRDQSVTTDPMEDLSEGLLPLMGDKDELRKDN